MQATFYACPRLRCYAPARAFLTRDEAEAYARQAAEQYRIGYAVWQRSQGRLAILKLFDPAPSKT
jgi:hypothetical protein